MEPRTRSPFPGMDPYLERNWSDVHGHLITYAADALNATLPDDLLARTERHVGVGDDADGDRAGAVVPDVEVLDRGGGTALAVAADLMSRLAPLRIDFAVKPARPGRRYVEVRDVDGRLVTVIEFVSPANKSGDGGRQFTSKRDRLIGAGVNVVEVDLTRGGGDWRRLYPPAVRRARGADAEFRAVIYAAPGVGDVGASVWLHPMPLGEPLPAVKIPLRPGETPVELALQPLVDAAYRNGRYGRTIDYDRACDPPLPDDVVTGRTPRSAPPAAP